MQPHDIRVIVAEVLAEQQRLHNKEADKGVLETIATILTSFGIEDQDRIELRADFQHLRRWRKSTEQITRAGWKAIVTVLGTGASGRLLLGMQLMVGKSVRT